MNYPTPCPDLPRLQDLLASRLPEEEQAALIGHLDSCSGCQNSLEEIAGGPPPLPAVWGESSGLPAAESAFWPALRRVQEEVAVQGPTRLEAGASFDLSLDFLSAADKPGILGRLSQFEVVEVIGRGGMGVVLRAFDPCLERYVALKVLDPLLANNETARKRFCREARAAASITHENVVAVHQVEREEDSGLPFLVMQVVTGESLQERLDRTGPLPLQDIVRIGKQTASGLAAAHAQGLVHRDIKPANILLEGGSRVRLTDFGLARAYDDVKITQTGFVPGTPLYMSPEQARGEPVDHRSDLFSLGGVMYAMCTGRAPFDGSTPFVVLKHVTEEAPRPIREINPAIPEWLVAVVEKLLAKNPEDRYQSAAEVVELLIARLVELHHTTQTAVATAPSTPASPPPATRPLLRWWLVLGILAVGVLVEAVVAEVLGLTHFTGWFHSAEAPQAPAPGDQGRPARAVFQGNAGPVWSVALSPDGKTAAMALDENTIKLWGVAEGEVRATLHGHKGPVWAVAFTPDGKTLVSGSTDKTVRLWDLPAGKQRRALEHSGPIRTLAVSTDGRLLATGCRDGSVRIWDLTMEREPVTMSGHSGEVLSVAISPNGKTVASASGDKTIKLWDAVTGVEQTTLEGHISAVYAVAFAPGGKTLASGGWDRKVHLWDAASGSERTPFTGHTLDIWSVAYSPAGNTLASGSEDRTVRLWDAGSGRELAVLKGHEASVYSVAFSADGKTVASAGRDGTVRLWDVAADGR
jgi:hypothetical protein